MIGKLISNLLLLDVRKVGIPSVKNYIQAIPVKCVGEGD